jgi:S-ribosylhomocysteine lyase LuxS involved in autoinducer biosynthesis
MQAGTSLPPQPAARDLLVKDVVREIKNNELINPFFQREFVWPVQKQKDFIDYTLQTGQLSASLHTYCVEGSLVRYLKDGRQRITTLRYAIDSPEKFNLSEAQVEVLKHVGVHIMHRQHENHDVAMVDFQNLNKGTGLLPYDLWRGELTNTEVGKHVYEKIKTVVTHVTADLAGTDVVKNSDMASSPGAHGRKRNGQLHRGALALFYMWISKQPVIENILTHNTYSKNAQPEVLVANFIRQQNWTVDIADREIQRFYDYLASVVALVKRRIAARDAAFSAANKLWEIQAVRALLNAGVFIHLRKDLPATLLQSVVDWYLERADGFKKWRSRFDVISRFKMGEKEECRMSQHNLYWLREAAAACETDIDRKTTTKPIVKGVQAKKGYHMSHVVPAVAGGVETIVEDAISNLSRGARQMTPEEVASLTSSAPNDLPQQTVFPFNEEQN